MKEYYACLYKTNDYMGRVMIIKYSFYARSPGYAVKYLNTLPREYDEEWELEEIL